MSSSSSTFSNMLNYLKKLVGFSSRFEALKFLAISVTKFFTVYIFIVLRGLEYSIFLPKMGAELISAVELYCLLPISSLFVILYFKLGKHFSRLKICGMLLIVFLIFFNIFNYFIFLNQDALGLDFLSLKLEYPRFKYPLLLLENWHISLFYVFAELWGIMMLSLSFWQLANEISTVTEARKYYGFFGAIGQLGMILGGTIAVKMSNIYPSIEPDAWINRFNWLINSVTISGIILLACYWWISKHIWQYVRIEERRYSKVKMSIRQSLKYIFTSRYLRLIATLIICYGVLMSISETLWKDQVLKLHSNSADYSAFVGKFQIYLGIGTFSGMLFAVVSLRKFSWLFNALSTPLSFGCTGIVFFSLISFREYLSPYFIAIGVPVVIATVTAGMVQILLAKTFKYTLFDLSKEMTFIPLDEELRTNGKAAVEIISSRVGRSGGSMIILSLLTIMPNSSLLSLSSYLFVIFIIILFIWFHAAVALNNEFEAIAIKSED